MSQIKKINNLYLEIFYEEEDDFPNRRIIKRNEKKIDEILEEITIDKKEQNKIYEAITSESFNTNDITYKPICDNLRKLRYTIIQGE